MINDKELVFVDRNYEDSNGASRARSDCTYVQADLALHAPQIKPVVAYSNVGLRALFLSVPRCLLLKNDR